MSGSTWAALPPLYGRRVGLQEALDQLDLPYARRDLERLFRPKVRTALDHLITGAPDACLEAIMDVATEVANSGGELPPGTGSGLVLHFHLRSKQIWQLVGDAVMPVETRFAFIQMAVLA